MPGGGHTLAGPVFFKNLVHRIQYLTAAATKEGNVARTDAIQQLRPEESSHQVQVVLSNWLQTLQT